MLSGDELRQILEGGDKLELPAELIAEEEDEQEDNLNLKKRNQKRLNVRWFGGSKEEEETNLMKGLMMVMRALMYQVG